MGPRMTDIEGSRRLIEVAVPDGYARGPTAERLPSVGTGHKACGQRLTLPSANCNIGGFGVDRVRLIVKSRQIGKFRRAFFQRYHQRTVIDVVSKHVETDFLAREPDLGSADQATGIVDQ